MRAYAPEVTWGQLIVFGVIAIAVGFWNRRPLTGDPADPRLSWWQRSSLQRAQRQQNWSGLTIGVGVALVVLGVILGMSAVTT